MVTELTTRRALLGAQAVLRTRVPSRVVLVAEVPGISGKDRLPASPAKDRKTAIHPGL